MNKYEVTIEEIVTYKVTIEANSPAHAERLAEKSTLSDMGMGSEMSLRSDSIRAMETRDITPLEQRIGNMIDELKSRGFTITPPKGNKNADREGSVSGTGPAPGAEETDA